MLGIHDVKELARGAGGWSRGLWVCFVTSLLAALRPLLARDFGFLSLAGG